MYARTKKGNQRLYWEGEYYLLTHAPIEIPAALARDVMGHINVEVSEAPFPAGPAAQETGARPAIQKPEQEKPASHDSGAAAQERQTSRGRAK